MLNCNEYNIGRYLLLKKITHSSSDLGKLLQGIYTLFQFRKVIHFKIVCLEKGLLTQGSIISEVRSWYLINLKKTAIFMYIIIVY